MYKLYILSLRKQKPVNVLIAAESEFKKRKLEKEKLIKVCCHFFLTSVDFFLLFEMPVYISPKGKGSDDTKTQGGGSRENEEAP